MEEERLDLEKLLYDPALDELEKKRRWREQKRKLMPILRAAGAVLLVAAVVLTAVLWPDTPAPEPYMPVASDPTSPSVGSAEPGIYSIDVPDMVDWKVFDLPTSGIDLSQDVYFTFSLEEEDLQEEEITFQISMNSGSFMDGGFLGGTPEREIGNNESIIWWGQSYDDFDEACEADGGVYLDVIVRAGEQVVGYAVAQIIHAETGLGYTVKILRSVYYPKVGGRFQPVTEEAVLQQIAQCKENR